MADLNLIPEPPEDYYDNPKLLPRYVRDIHERVKDLEAAKEKDKLLERVTWIENRLTFLAGLWAASVVSAAIIGALIDRYFVGRG